MRTLVSGNNPDSIQLVGKAGSTPISKGATVYFEADGITLTEVANARPAGVLVQDLQAGELGYTKVFGRLANGTFVNAFAGAATVQARIAFFGAALNVGGAATAALTTNGTPTVYSPGSIVGASISISETEWVQGQFEIPSVTGTMNCSVYWTPVTAAANNVIWGVEFNSTVADGSLTAALSASSNVTTTASATGNILKVSQITIAPTAGLFRFKLSRLASTLVGDVHLLGVKFTWLP